MLEYESVKKHQMFSDSERVCRISRLVERMPKMPHGEFYNLLRETGEEKRMTHGNSVGQERMTENRTPSQRVQ